PRPDSPWRPAREELTGAGRALVVAGGAGPSPSRCAQLGRRRVRVLPSRTRCLGSARRSPPPGFEDGGVAAGSDPAMASDGSAKALALHLPGASTCPVARATGSSVTPTLRTTPGRERVD
ncbi:hypothetical protein H8959_005052, partial [Pygathrix nigripes]